MMLYAEDNQFAADHALFAEVHMSQKTYDLVVMFKDKVRLGPPSLTRCQQV